jgi:hypothetical protein
MRQTTEAIPIEMLMGTFRKIKTMNNKRPIKPIMVAPSFLMAGRADCGRLAREGRVSEGTQLL